MSKNRFGSTQGVFIVFTRNNVNEHMDHMKRQMAWLLMNRCPFFPKPYWHEKAIRNLLIEKAQGKQASVRFQINFVSSHGKNLQNCTKDSPIKSKDDQYGLEKGHFVEVTYQSNFLQSEVTLVEFLMIT